MTKDQVEASMKLADIVLRLNEKADSLGEGMCLNMKELAKIIKGSDDNSNSVNGGKCGS